MHAYLVDSLSVQQFISSTVKGKILEFPFQKISDVRELQKFTKLALSEKTAIILKDVDLATEEAHNAFLKNLEEPQENLIYILTASNIELLPETIRSRCQVIETGNRQQAIGTEETIENFLKQSIGNKLKAISKIAKREEAIDFLTNLLYSAHESIKKGINISDFVDQALKTLKNIKANGNVQLQLTNFVVNFRN
ncbi:hypothetical protein HY008_01855 [Candidatus Woesebacteria bacterium]|nr:hypothetical protein [Candidatus Woesebacteria bacterium]